jgi:hypothetical protein
MGSKVSVEELTSSIRGEKVTSHQNTKSYKANQIATINPTQFSSSSSKSKYEFEEVNKFPLIFFNKINDTIEMRNYADSLSSSTSSSTYESIDNISELDLIEFDDEDGSSSNYSGSSSSNSSTQQPANFYMSSHTRRKRADSCENFVVIVDNFTASPCEHHLTRNSLKPSNRKSDIILNVMNINYEYKNTNKSYL